MYPNELIPEELQTFNYYRYHIPLFLRNSYGYIEHFRIWYELLMGEGGFVPAYDHILNMLDIFAEDYLERLAEIDPLGTECDILDKLAMLFEVDRNIHVEYTDNGTDYSEDLTLTNDELLILIKGQIIKNYCQGTRDQINWYYENAGLNILSVAVTLTDTPTCHLILIDDPDNPYSSNIRKMFLAGLLNVEQLGVRYEYEIVSISANTLIWDSNDANELWDVGAWWI